MLYIYIFVVYSLVISKGFLGYKVLMKYSRDYLTLKT